MSRARCMELLAGWRCRKAERKCSVLVGGNQIGGFGV